MDYKEFLKEIRRRIQEKVDGEVRAETIKKNNSVNMDGLLIQEKGQNISPVIYLNPYYRSIWMAEIWSGLRMIFIDAI